MIELTALQRKIVGCLMANSEPLSALSIAVYLKSTDIGVFSSLRGLEKKKLVRRTEGIDYRRRIRWAIPEEVKTHYQPLPPAPSQAQEGRG